MGKILLAARAIAAVENPQDVFVCASRPYTQRAVLKFARYVNCSPVAGRFTPGAFTNQIQAAFREPRLLVISDPRAGHQPVTEGSYANIPVIAFCNIDSPTKFIDIAIPCNNKSPHSIGLMWWMLAREVLRLRGSIGRGTPWEVMPDLFFYRDPEGAEKAEAQMMKTGDFSAPAKEDWGAEGGVEDWSADGQTAAPAAAPPAIAAPAQGYQVTEDWSAQTETSDWAAASAGPADQPQAAAAPANNWGGSSNW